MAQEGSGKKFRVVAHVPEYIKRAVEETAAREMISESAVIRKLLQEALTAREEANGTDL